jgi:hypothetical protein
MNDFDHGKLDVYVAAIDFVALADVANSYFASWRCSFS